MFRLLTAVTIVSLSLAHAARAEPRVTAASEPQVVTESEGVRLRGGFSFNGGGGFGVAGGGSASFGARLGVQFGRYFSTYYQASPIVFLAGNDNGIAAGFLMANSLLANVTLADFLDVGVGPSLDYSAIAGCNSGFDCDAAKGLEFGLHGRLAINLGGRDRLTGRRSAFSIGVDVHPIFTPAGTLFIATGGIGGEWF